MNLSGNYFEYDGMRSYSFGLRILRINTDRLTQLSGEVEYKMSFDRINKKSRIGGIDWSSSPLARDIEFICEEPLDDSKARTVKRLLFNRSDFKKLYVDAACDKSVEVISGKRVREYVECVFYAPEEIRFADGLHGFRAKMQLATPMALQEPITLSYENLTGVDTDIISIPCDTDIEDYIYPVLNFTCCNEAELGSRHLVNASDSDREFELRGVTDGTVLTVDNAIGTVLDNTGKSWYNYVLSGKQTFRLLPGNNKVKVYGLSNLYVTFQNARWFL